MLLNTERGSIFVTTGGVAYTEKQAKADGFGYAFHSTDLGLDVYSKVLDVLENTREFKVLVNKNLDDKKLCEKLEQIDDLNKRKEKDVYRYYRPFVPDSRQLFVLTDEEIPIYNNLVEKMNEDIRWLEDYKENFPDNFSLFDDVEFKKRFDSHSVAYDKLLGIHENAIIRTSEERDNGSEHDNDDIDKE